MIPIVYIPPAVIHQEEARPYSSPYFFECGDVIINLAAAKEFYVDHVPFTSSYYPKVQIGSTSYCLTDPFDTKEKALDFLRKLTERISLENRRR